VAHEAQRDTAVFCCVDPTTIAFSRHPSYSESRTMPTTLSIGHSFPWPADTAAAGLFWLVAQPLTHNHHDSRSLAPTRRPKEQAVDLGAS
jgi:hypothetical protein